MDKSDCLLISRHLDNKADNRVSWHISRFSRPPIVVPNHPHSSFCSYQRRIANCIRAERFVKCVWMNSCLGFWLFEFGLVIVFTHILTPPINHRSVARPSPTPGLLRRNTSDVWAGGLWRGREVEISFPQPAMPADRQQWAAVCRRVILCAGHWVHFVC